MRLYRNMNMGLMRGFLNLFFFLFAIIALGVDLNAQVQSPFELRYRLNEIDNQAQDSVSQNIIEEENTPTETIGISEVEDTTSIDRTTTDESESDLEYEGGGRSMDILASSFSSDYSHFDNLR